MIKELSKGQGLQTAWQCETCQTLIEPMSKGQGLQAAWQCQTAQIISEFTQVY